jgi:RNA polymerase subunit RPABC4/transcription elongation factor Spt4
MTLRQCASSPASCYPSFSKEAPGQDCKKFSDKILSLIDYEKGDVVCPKCGSKKVEQRWSAFTVITSKKSA